LLMVKKQPAPGTVVRGARVGMSERKDMVSTSGVDSRVVWCGGVHRKQPRAGAGRAISFGDGISNGCVDVYVRC